MLRIASVALVPDGRVLLQPFSATTGGPVVYDGLPLVLPSMSSERELGRAAVAALTASNRRVLPARDLRRDPVDREFLDWYGVATYGEYSRGVRSVGLSASFVDVIDQVRVRPNRNLGPRGGFEGIANELRVVEFTDPEHLGLEIQDAMTKATPGRGSGFRWMRG